MDHTDKVVTMIDECRAMGLEVQAPDVNASGYTFRVAGDSTLRYGLGAVKGVGRAAIEAIVDVRDRDGPYTSLAELCRRVDLSRLNRRALEALVRAGALDALGPNRATLMAGLAAAVQGGEQHARTREAGQVDLFGAPAGRPRPADSAAAPSAAATSLPEALIAEWSVSERLAGERATLGLYLSGHPVAPYESDWRHFASGRIAEYLGERQPASDALRSYAEARPATLAGLVLEVRRRGSRVSVLLDDRSGRIEVTLFDEVFQRHRALLVRDALIQVQGNLRFDEFSDAWRLHGRQVASLPAIRERLARALILRWPQGPASQKLLPKLEALLASSRGGPCAVLLRYCSSEASGTLSCPEEWKVRASTQLLEALEALVGPSGVRLVYASAVEAPALAQ